jgi:hypothetical protein
MTSDDQALQEMRHHPLALPAGLTITWLGVSGYRLTYSFQVDEIGAVSSAARIVALPRVDLA